MEVLNLHRFNSMKAWVYEEACVLTILIFTCFVFHKYPQVDETLKFVTFVIVFPHNISSRAQI